MRMKCTTPACGPLQRWRALDQPSIARIIRPLHPLLLPDWREGKHHGATFQLPQLCGWDGRPGERQTSLSLLEHRTACTHLSGSTGLRLWDMIYDRYVLC